MISSSPPCGNQWDPLRLDVNKTSGSPLFDAVKANKKSVVEALLTHGAAVNTSGWTPGPAVLGCSGMEGSGAI